jgi:N-acetylglutamate synthase-like GNAT family acetyltransferase
MEVEMINDFVSKKVRRELFDRQNDIIEEVRENRGRIENVEKKVDRSGLIDFDRSAIDIYNFVRALTKPYPGAYYYDENKNKIIVCKIEIVFDEARLQKDDMVFDTQDLKVKILEWEMIEIRQIEREREFRALLEFLSTIYPNQPKEQIEKNANMPKKESISLALEDNKIIGSCWCVDLKFSEYKVGGIGGLAVDEKYRGNEIAKNLVNFITNTIALYETYLAWTRVVNFFVKLGFRDFSNGIERLDTDSTPIIKTMNEFLKYNYPNPKWERVKF